MAKLSLDAMVSRDALRRMVARDCDLITGAHDAETKHDPKNGQFTGSGGTGQGGRGPRDRKEAEWLDKQKHELKQILQRKGTPDEGEGDPGREAELRHRIKGYGSDEPFEKLEHSLAHKKGVHNAPALAAWIGREHGKIS